MKWQNEILFAYQVPKVITFWCESFKLGMWVLSEIMNYADDALYSIASHWWP